MNVQRSIIYYSLKVENAQNVQVWWVLTNIYTHVMTTTVKIENILIHQKVYICPFLVNLSIPNQGNLD